MTVLVDTSVWIDHLRKANSRLIQLLENEEVAVHPFVIGELACGNLKNREEILSLLKALPFTPKVDDDEILFFLAEHPLPGRGLGLIDIHLLASAKLGPHELWTKDKRLARIASELGLSNTGVSST